MEINCEHPGFYDVSSLLEEAFEGTEVFHSGYIAEVPCTEHEDHTHTILYLYANKRVPQGRPMFKVGIDPDVFRDGGVELAKVFREGLEQEMHNFLIKHSAPWN